jgi:hypothetical protein
MKIISTIGFLLWPLTPPSHILIVLVLISMSIELQIERHLSWLTKPKEIINRWLTIGIWF